MKPKILIIIVLIFLSNFTFPQKFNTSLILSSGTSWYNSKNSEVKNKKIGFCFSGLIREEYKFSKLISINVEIDYLNSFGSFENVYYINTIPEIHNNFKHNLSVQSFDIPIIFKLRTKIDKIKNIYLYTGIGVSYILKSNRTVYIVTTYDNSPDKKDIIQISKGNTSLINHSNENIGMFGLIGLGKTLLIKNKNFLFEIKYRFDLNDWIYSTVNDPVNNNFNIKRQGLLLSLGMSF